MKRFGIIMCLWIVLSMSFSGTLAYAVEKYIGDTPPSKRMILFSFYIILKKKVADGLISAGDYKRTDVEVQSIEKDGPNSYRVTLRPLENSYENFMKILELKRLQTGEWAISDPFPTDVNDIKHFFVFKE